MSLPEILLLLHRAGVKRAFELLMEHRSRYLASAAKWSKEASEHYREFGELLRARIGGDDVAPQKPKKAQLIALFGVLGIKPAPQN